MLVRSQDKEQIVNLKRIEHISIQPTGRENPSFEIIFRIRNFEYLLGIYSTKTQALEILDEIENEYRRVTICNYGYFNSPKVFHMPEDWGETH